MVLLRQTKRKNSHRRLLRNIIIGAFILSTTLMVFIVSYALHSPDNPSCKCLNCLLNQMDDGEYLYNRYMPVITVFWIVIIFLPVYLLRHKK